MTQKIIITDLHNDVLVTKPAKTRAVLKRANAVLAVWTTKLKDPLHALKTAQTNALWAIEDLGFLAQTGVGVLAQFNPVYASLTWNNENALAGGAHCDAGLTDFGKTAIQALETQKIALDTAHLNPKSFFGAAEVATRPFICSHACFNGVFNHKRNLSDNQISAIIKSGGIVGLTFVSEFLTGEGKSKIKDVIKHIEYFGSKFGLNNLAIGSDFYGTKHPALKNYAAFKKLENELLRLNYSNSQINAVFSQNATDFFAKNSTGE